MDEVFLRNDLFAGLSSQVIDSLDIHVEERHYDRDEVLFEEGDPGEHLFLQASGSVRMSKRGRGGEQEMLSVALPNQFFGELSLLDDLPQSERATAAESTLVGLINRETLNHLLSHSSEAGLHVTQAIGRHLRSTNSLLIRELLGADRLSLVGGMMGSVVHDFRNPIASIRLASEYLNSREDDEQLLKIGVILQTATNRMLHMIDGLLNFSSGANRIDLEKWSVRELLQGLEVQSLQLARREGIEVRVDAAYEGEITVDRNRILRLFGNIISNAVESMSGGGTLTLRVRKVDGNVKFEFEDAGCGIPADILPRLFDPFVTFGKRQGTGLGMAIAKAVVEEHHGKIWAESEHGEGAVFHVSLPVIP